MKYLAITISTYWLCLGCTLFASNVATQTITFSVQAISEIGFSGDPPAFIATSAVPGQDPLPVLDNSTFYAVTTNGSSEKVTASIDTNMPAGTELCIMVAAPVNATSTGIVDLDTTNQNVVTGITQVAQANLQVSYMFESTAAAGIIPLMTRIVTFTLSP